MANSNATGAIPKAQKAKRKISLPWFKQVSVAQPHPTLTRQHTIDTPSSFQARLRRQPSQSALVNILIFSAIYTTHTFIISKTLIRVYFELIFVYDIMPCRFEM